MAQILQVLLPALFSITMQDLTIKAGQFRRGLGTTHRQRLPRGTNDASVKRIKRTLCLLVKCTQGINFITKELDANRARQCWREEVNNTTSMTELAGLFDFRYRLIAKIVEVLQHKR